VSHPRSRSVLIATSTMLSLLLASSFLTHVAAQERRAVTETKEEPSKDIPIPQETTAVTQHQESIDGQTIHYTATAGNLLISKEDHDEIEKPYHSVFLHCLYRRRRRRQILAQ
jgi:carboxypeptidase C (cathepsin A)